MLLTNSLHKMQIRFCLRILPRKISVKQLNNAGADPGEVKWLNFQPPLFFLRPFFLFFLIISTRLRWFSYIITKIHPPPHFKILDPRLQREKELCQ